MKVGVSVNEVLEVRSYIWGLSRLAVMEMGQQVVGPQLEM